MRINIDKDEFEEFVSHVQTLVTHYLKPSFNSLSVRYALDRLSDMLKTESFDIKRFQVRRTVSRGYVIWDANKQCKHRCGSMNSGPLFYTREKQWADAKCSQLNSEHAKYNMPAAEADAAYDGRSGE